MIKIIVKGPQGSGKTRVSRVIQCALLRDPKFNFESVDIIDGDELNPSCAGKPDVLIKVKQ